MEKAYNRINWVNGSESLDTPLNDDNLNIMDAALNTIDNRVVEHDAQINNLRGYETRAAQSASEAIASANSASQSASGASSSASSASTSATNAHTSETNASASESASASSEANAAQSEENSEAWAIGKRGGVDVGSSDETYHNNSKYYASDASSSASSASTSASNASTCEANANISASSAASSASSASSSASDASSSASSAASSASSASSSASDANDSATDAAKWCDNGGDSGQSTPSATNNAYHWAMLAQTYATGAVRWMGDTTFANIPLSGMVRGDMYNVTDEFTTDSRFNVGVGIICPPGTNIIWGTDKWDVQAPPYKASQISYSNASSGMSATNVQGAIDELSVDVSKAARGVVGTEAEIMSMISRGEIEDGTPVDIIDDEDPDEITALQVTYGNTTLKNTLDSMTTTLAGKQSQALSQQIAGQSTVEGALGAMQPKTLSQSVAGQSTVEGALSTINSSLTNLTSTVSALGMKKIFNFNLTAGLYVTTSYNDNWHKNKYYAIFHNLNNDVCHFYLRQCTTEHQMEVNAMDGGAFRQYDNIAIELG